MNPDVASAVVGPKTTAAVILGASAFPGLPSIGLAETKQWTNSASALQKYLVSTCGLSTERDILNLFNQEAPVGEMVSQIRGFLEENARGKDHLLVAFFGHGVKVKKDQGETYYLCIRSSQERTLASSALTAETVAEALDLETSPLNIYLLIDACFAERLSALCHMPGADAILLASAEKDREAKIYIDEEKDRYTVFFQALLDVLSFTGDHQKPLSLPDLHRKIVARCERRFNDAKIAAFPRPVLHGAQRGGNQLLFPLRRRRPVPSPSPSTPKPLGLAFQRWPGDPQSAVSPLDDILSSFARQTSAGARCLCLVVHFAADAELVITWARQHFLASGAPVKLVAVDADTVARGGKSWGGDANGVLVLSFAAFWWESGGIPSPTQLETVAGLLSAVYRTTQQTAGRVVLVLPRAWLACHAIHDLVTMTESYIAAPLFVSRLPPSANGHVEAGPKLSADLTAFRAANSPALVVSFTDFLARSSPEPPAGEARRDWLLALATHFARGGFWEPALRLELHCRFLDEDPGEPQQADLEPLFDDPQEIKGLVEALEAVPQLAVRVVVENLGDMGPASPFRRVVRYWALPRLPGQGKPFPSWLPLLLACDKVEAADLTRPLMAAFALGRSLPGYRLPLPAHARLAELVSGEQLRWLLSSPLLLVLEAVTQPAAPLFSFLSTFPETGCVASWPDDILPWEDKSFTEFFKGGVSARLRRPVLVTPGPSPTALGVAPTYFDKPLGAALITPFLTREVSELLNRDAADEGCGRYQILDGYVQRLAKRLSALEQAEILDEVLPELAFAVKCRRRKRWRGATAEQEAAVRRLQPGLVRELNSEWPFTHNVVLDFFAARFLARAEPQKRLAGMCRLLERVNREQECEVLFAFLLRQLDPLSRDEALNVLADKSPRLACRSLQEYPRKALAGSVAAQNVLRKVAGTLGTGHDWGNWEAAVALGFHDPRLDPEDPLANMVDLGRPRFRLGKFPVTNLEYAAFVAAGGYQVQRWWSHAGWQWRERTETRHPALWYHTELHQSNAPVVGVSYFEAEAYCRWLSAQRGPSGQLPRVVFRLPTPEERDPAGSQVTWESLGLLPGGKFLEEPEFSTEQLLEDVLRKLNLEALRDALTVLPDHPTEGRPVGLFPSEAWGCHDLYGLVWEWCASADPETPGRRHLAWVKGGPLTTHSALLSNVLGSMFDPEIQFYQIGFRLACDLP